LYYANDEQFTRLVEYKKFTHHRSPTSLVGMEIPSLNGKHYPLPFKSEQELARKYYALMPEHVYSTGRAGSYRYALDIDDCIEQAMLMAQQIKEGGRDYPDPVKERRIYTNKIEADGGRGTVYQNRDLIIGDTRDDICLPDGEPVVF